MTFLEMPLSQLQTYQPSRTEPADFDSFWQTTLAQAADHPLHVQFEPVDSGLRAVEVFDVSFSGYAGQRVKGWLLLPAHRSQPLPCVVEYIGYGGGRGLPHERLLWSAAGYAHLIMDTRGQGSAWSRGDTPDLDPDGMPPQFPGFMTRGILSPQSYYYRRVFADAIRAVETAQNHAAIDASRIAVTGGSQGGGIALAVAGLSHAVQIAMPNVPFLCHYRRATEIAGTHPYVEIAKYLAVHRDRVEQVFNTLSYFDGVNFAPRAQAEALFSVGLMDEICPPSTVYAAYNHYVGPKQIEVWQYNHHEGGGAFQDGQQIKFLQSRWSV